MTQLLVSIKSAWVDAIFDYKKDIELRKIPPLKPVSHLIIYEKGQGIVGRAEIKEIITRSILDIFSLTNQGQRSCTSLSFFQDYYQGKSKGTAIIIENPELLAFPITSKEVKEILGKFTPPQNFIYIEDSDWDKLIKKTQPIGVQVYIYD